MSSIKLSANRRLRYAVHSGKIHRPNYCSKCGEGCIPHGHHTDYKKPLDVVWLCASCHRSEHANMQALNRGPITDHELEIINFRPNEAIKEFLLENENLIARFKNRSHFYLTVFRRGIKEIDNSLGL